MNHSKNKMIKILSPKNKKMTIYAVLIASLSGLFDLIGVSSILPLLSVLANPEILTTNETIKYFYDIANLSKNKFIILLSFFSFSLLLINQCLRLYSNWFILKLSENLLFEKSRDLFFYYLIRPYKLFLKSDTSHLLQKCTNYVNASVAGYFSPFLIILSQLFTILFIVSFLIYYNPIVTLFLITTLILFYFTILIYLKQKIKNLGKSSPLFFKDTARVITDTFETYKEFKLSNNKKYFLGLFEKPAEKYRNAHISINLFQQFPAFAIEVFSYAIILIISLYFYFKLDNFNEILPIIGVITLSLKRLIPAAQNIYTQITQIGFYKNSFNIIINDLIRSVDISNNYKEENFGSKSSFTKFIEFKKISFSYHKEKTILNLSTKIEKGSFIGISGLSGQGKTTFLDIFCGLLKPSKGEINIDGKLTNILDEKTWINNISYAPQKGHLLNQSIIKNITFDNRKINLKKIKKICKIAEISDFIEKKLDNGYNTIIGENGVRVSGGQAQRLVLARALYSSPQILILDEATNSIDTLTEKKIISNIRKNFKDLTILFVSHRVNIIKNTDKILFFENRKIRFEGNYAKIKNKSKIFQRLIKANNTSK
jgi:ABC-type bacteriocin/lantibiotic exporter with double-glycine peptidase domain